MATAVGGSPLSGLGWVDSMRLGVPPSRLYDSPAPVPAAAALGGATVSQSMSGTADDTGILGLSMLSAILLALGAFYVATRGRQF